jgi:C1A family cysteine protease
MDTANRRNRNGRRRKFSEIIAKKQVKFPAKPEIFRTGVCASALHPPICETVMKNLPFLRSFWLLLLLAPLVSSQTTELPRTYDLRKSAGITPIKSQKGGTCWAHGTCAAIESNLLVSGAWKKFGNGSSMPALSEYHLDWWNGFNRHTNADLEDATKDPTGMTVHQGGDYRVSTAYISRGDGIIAAPLKEDKTVDLSWFDKAPDLRHPEYRKFYVRDVEWFTIGDNLERIDDIKRRIMKEGAMGTAYCAGPRFTAKDFVIHQPLDNPAKPNHAVAIVGWDDDKISADPDKKAPKPGAWLIKNSWGTSRIGKDKKPTSVGEDGFYWISYYDRVSCRDPEMGAVSFRNVEPMRYSHVYYHDYHGWRSTIKDIAKACNVFKATADHKLAAVSFYTAADNVKYTAQIYSKFANGAPQGLLATKTGVIERTGFHTVDLDKVLNVAKGDSFVVCLEVSAGGQAIDRTSEIEVLLQPDPKKPEDKKVEIQPKKKGGFAKGPRGPNGGPIVLSKANPEESYYFNGVIWRDLYEYRFDNPNWAMFDRSANFCMKALAAN